MPDPVLPRANYILDLKIAGIRCFGEQEQSLNLQTTDGRPAQWTLILGNNGSGKTTLLEWIAFQNYTQRFTNGASSGLDLIQTLRDRQVNIESFHEWIDTLPRMQTERYHIRVNVSTAQSLTESVPLKPASGPLLAYAYGVHRGLSNATSLPDASTRPWSLFLNEPDLIDAEEWLRRLDYSARVPSDIQAEQRAAFNRCKDLILKILPENEVQDIRISTPTRGRPDPHVEFKTPYGWIPLRQLGHGFRSVIAWMVDLAYRMTERYPNSPDPLAEAALVLVDEIDLHLHPVWQRQLMGYLSSRFPNTQFVATAHSPLIVQAATEDTNIALLRRVGDHVEIDNDIKSIRNWRIDQILTSELFGVPTARPPEIDDKLRRRTQLLEKSELTPADEAEIARLEQQIGPLPTGETASDAIRSVELLERTQRLLEKYEKAESSP